MKYVRSFESYRNSKKLEPINEELFGGILNFFKNLWNKASEEIKKSLGENPSIDKLEDWIDKNPLNPTDDSYLFKGLLDEFRKKPEANDEDCLNLVSNILDPETGSLGKQGLQPLYDSLLKTFGKNLAPLNIIQFLFENIRNRAIKDYKYAGGPDAGKVDPKKINKDVKDTTHLPDFKKILIAATDPKKKKEAALNWVEKTLVPRLDKYLSEVKDEDLEKYLQSKNIEVPTDAADFKVGDTVVYKREKFNQEEWDKLTDDDKKKPEEGKMKELQADQIGIKKISKIEGDKVSFEGADFTKTISDLLMKSEVVKAEGQEDLVKTLGEVKSKNPDAIKKLGDIADLYKDPEANKDKIAEIEKQLGGEEGK